MRFRFPARSGFGDVNRVGQLADLQAHIHARHLGDLQDQAAAHEFFEAGLFDRDRIRARFQAGHGIQALVVGRALERDARFDVRDGEGKRPARRPRKRLSLRR